MTATMPRLSTMVVPADRGSLVLVDPELDSPEPLMRELLSQGVDLQVYAEPFRALAHMGAHRADALVLSTALGRSTLVRMAEAAREEIRVPVVLAIHDVDVATIGPAVIAGARPLVFLPYTCDSLAGALRQVALPLPPPTEVVVGPLVLDSASHSATIAGRGFDLSVVELGVLYDLAVNHDHVVPRDDLMSRYFRRSLDADSALVAAVSRLRRKLAPFGVADAVHTVRGFGYRLDSYVLAAAFAGSKA